MTRHLLIMLVAATCLWGTLALGQATTEPSNFPGPQELANQSRDLTTAGARPQVAYFNLADPVSEKPAGFSLLAGTDSSTFREILRRVEKARDDKNIKAVLFTLGDGVLNLEQSLELRDLLLDLRKQNKRSFVYADTYDMSSYLVASGASDICMMDGGDIEMPGVGLETMFAKGTLDLVGVQADYIQIGKFKGADEMFTRTGPSPELSGELNRLVDSIYAELVETISSSRKLPPDQVKACFDLAMVPAKQAKEKGLVDHLIDVDGLRDLMAEQLGGRVTLVHDYGVEQQPTIDLSSPFAILSLLNKKPAEASSKPCVAIIYAEGEIVDGAAGESLFSAADTIGSEDIRQAMRMAERDKNIKAIVLRIDSPGGSALASEAMWQAVRRAAAQKPVVISVGTMAASGGYYLATSGNYIFADPTAIVGSIGVVGGKFVLKDLFNKVGISTYNVQRGANADLFSEDTPWTDAQRQLVTDWMHQTYDQFTDRVMTTRKDKIANIDDVAQGRIFMARQAKDLGLVDEIGGEQSALDYAASKGGLASGQYDVRVLPPTKTLADILSGAAGGTQSLSNIAPHVSIADDSLLGVMSPATRQLVIKQLRMMELFQKHPVQLLWPVTIETH
jgi:protease-4